ncbi:MAG: N-acetyl-gamma-glutamyl-phosphate reductase [Candidatus Omnitrophica bacterium]|nr:N-acetyl-gamma-glutamyl-phosphate reductase [Candidatus Omnitrophota bacterium]
MPTIRVAIAGATGYTGEELLRILIHHPHVQLTYLAASAKWGRPTPVSEVYPRFAGRVDLAVEALNLSRCTDVSDVVFLALPHGMAMELAPKLLAAGKRVIDLSGDFRLHEPSLYPQWYTFSHTHPEWLKPGAAAYGLAEFCQGEIAKATLVANPGCYATSVLLGLLPLFRAKLVDSRRVIIDAKSGVSGAGRKPEPSLLYAEMSENLRAYKVNAHQHMPEINQTIRQLTGSEIQMVFVPQVIPATRGLISMLYLQAKTTEAQARAAFAAAYSPETTPFVRVRSSGFPQLSEVTHTNYCDLGIMVDSATGTMLIASALDNLVKGAAGQAVQNLNIMHGWPETTGLL